MQPPQQPDQGHPSSDSQAPRVPPMNGGAANEHDPGFNGPLRTHSPFPPPFMHPEMMHMMQQAHMQQQQHLYHQRQQQLHGQPFHTSQVPGAETAGPGSRFPLQGDQASSEQDSTSQAPLNGPVHPAHFMAMNRMTPPPGFGHYPIHSMQGPPFQPQFPHQYPPHLQWQQQQQIHHQQQLFMHQQMLRQQQQMHQFQADQQQQQQHPSQQDLSRHGLGEPGSHPSHGQDAGTDGPPQQTQIRDIESHINQLLFQGDASEPGPGTLTGGLAQRSNRPLSARTVQEIEEAQIKDLQDQVRRVSLTDPASTSMSRSNPADATAAIAPNREATAARHTSGEQLSSILQSRFKDPVIDTAPRFEPAVERAAFSAKDIDFYSDRKYDPYRPSTNVFDLITRDAKALCQELMPNPEEETRKLALLERLSDIATEVFGEAEVLPFGSSGNGLALANADMDVCVFLNSKEGSAEEQVSPVEFVERIGDRLEKDNEFENILQLKRARVPIVKLNHVNGIACDIGYQNDLAIWNTRLLRAYCRIDTRVRDVVVIIKTWAKRRKINNPYAGSLSSYAYVLLVIHVLQRRGVLPNLQSIVVGNGKIPYWDCQGFNRYFFEDIPNLARYWQPTPEAMKQSVGELLYEFFRYFASEFRYTTHVVSIRSGGLLTKEAKEWSKDHTQPQQQQHQRQQPQTLQPQTSTVDSPALTDEQPAADSKPVVKNRYLFCIEDPFELDHNVGRPVDRYSLFTIRGEFMRAAKILSRNGEGAISRLCYEREVPVHQERNRHSSIDHGDNANKDNQQQQKGSPVPKAKDAHGDIHVGNNNDRRGSSGSGGGGGRVMAFPAGEDRVQERSSVTNSRTLFQSSLDGSVASSSLAGSGSHLASGPLGEQEPRPRSGRRSHYNKRATVASEPRSFTRA
ncbi:hypothetical protein BGZ99_005705 [Dissophora globulifera]|uniref:polynucleotide adenylyltransferase n=1 Tax=Dissophora globulifera TaxID=979702 RepID=A0A9P6REF7_9FUNG|nr:hypothetical protein BGZ99_005705 [Dissophora globulifera]